MFFKNLIIYRLAEAFQWDKEQLNEQLQSKVFAPCPKSESFSLGWISPYGKDHDNLVHQFRDCFLIAFCKEEKILPSTVIREELEKKVSAIEKTEDRILYRKEKIALRDQIIINLRHQAFSRKRITLAYLDTKKGFLLVDSSSRNKAEELSAFLRTTLGSLKLALPETLSQPETIMTSWLLEGQRFPSLDIQNHCDMLDPSQKTSMIKCKEQDLSAKEIINHLKSGKQIVRLALNWQDKISFDVAEDLGLKRIKFLELLQEQRTGANSQSPQEKVDTEFAIMAGEFSQLLDDLWSAFDGLTPINP